MCPNTLFFIERLVILGWGPLESVHSKLITSVKSLLANELSFPGTGKQNFDISFVEWGTSQPVILLKDICPTMGMNLL